jgi:hypothetical protein
MAADTGVEFHAVFETAVHALTVKGHDGMRRISDQSRHAAVVPGLRRHGSQKAHGAILEFRDTIGHHSRASGKLLERKLFDDRGVGQTLETEFASSWPETGWR